jgi:glycosyltransferase involved in cell wall biosynthesis
MISVIIPTYKEPDVLELCIKSALEGQVNTNEIIVVVDGFYDINKDILLKYNNKIKIIELLENSGLCRATNIGVFNASNDLVLIVNDDNVFPSNWDINLENAYSENSVLTPNQIEPFTSIFPQFIIKDFGRSAKDFKKEEFDKFCKLFENEPCLEGGYTFPIFISKKNFLKIGGFDESYPSQAGYVADWEFFIKAELCGMNFYRDFGTKFYHFVSTSAKSEAKKEQSRIEEIDCHKYFYYKWGFKPYNRALMKNI